MPVKIENMDMPKCCAECRFYIASVDNWSSPSFCSAILDTEREWTKIAKDTEKPFWCPLKEAKE